MTINVKKVGQRAVKLTKGEKTEVRPVAYAGGHYVYAKPTLSHKFGRATVTVVLK